MSSGSGSPQSVLNFIPAHSTARIIPITHLFFNMNFIVILATMTAFWHRGSTQSADREGKYLGYGTDDLWGDIFDELNDPIPMPHNSISVKQHVLKKLQKNKITKPEPMPPLPIPLQLVQQVTTSPPPPSTSTTEETILKVRRRNVTRPEPLLLYDTSTQKFEVTPAGFASHVRPLTEGMFMIGGKFEEQVQHPPNMTDKNLKLFWSSVGDFIETVPFLPIQVNVPDLLAAMATFFSQRIPLINRITNPNEPRPKIPIKADPPSPIEYHNFPVETNLLEYRNMAPPTAKPKKNKKRKQNKKKGSNRRQTTESDKLKGSYLSTQVPRNQPTSRTWFAKSTETPAARSTTENSKLFHHNNSPDAEQIKYKNMPITRKTNRWADRELFNFKHSDISNSPIMILNMPSRPVLLYKFNHELKTK